MPVVVRAEMYYLPPPRGPGDAWDQVPAAERVFWWVDYRMGRRVPLPTSHTAGSPPLFARIDQNRWIGDCPTCNSACIVSPTDPRYGCTECGLGWITLVFPADVPAVEAEMLTIPHPFLRNWQNPAASKEG